MTNATVRLHMVAAAAVTCEDAGGTVHLFERSEILPTWVSVPVLDRLTRRGLVIALDVPVPDDGVRQTYPIAPDPAEEDEPDA